MVAFLHYSIYMYQLQMYMCITVISNNKIINSFFSYIGHGGNEGAMECCGDCRGTGVQVRIQQFAPGMVQQIQSICHEVRVSTSTPYTGASSVSARKSSESASYSRCM